MQSVSLYVKDDRFDPEVGDFFRAKEKLQVSLLLEGKCVLSQLIT